MIVKMQVYTITSDAIEAADFIQKWYLKRPSSPFNESKEMDIRMAFILLVPKQQFKISPAQPPLGISYNTKAHSLRTAFFCWHCQFLGFDKKYWNIFQWDISVTVTHGPRYCTSIISTTAYHQYGTTHRVPGTEIGMPKEKLPRFPALLHPQQNYFLRMNKVYTIKHSNVTRCYFYGHCQRALAPLPTLLILLPFSLPLQKIYFLLWQLCAVK